MQFKMLSALMLLCFCALAQDTPADVEREWGKQSGAFRLSISSNKPQYAAGEAIKITAVLKNVTDSSAYIARPTPPEFYNMDVRMPTPDWIPFKPQAVLTTLGDQQRHPSRSSMVGWDLQAGADVTNDFELHKLYTMSVPGEYHVTFSCKIPVKKIGEPLLVITSNELKITVLGDNR
jgi:hypothetical protein